MKLADLAIKDQPQDVFWHVNNIFVKKLVLEKRGYCAVGHSHEYDHLTLIAKGAVSIIVDGVETIYRAGDAVSVAANKHHAVTAEEDDTVFYCIHDTRGMDLDELAKPFDYEKEISE